MSQRSLSFASIVLVFATTVAAEAQEAGFQALQPCRLVDTRPENAPLVPDQIRTFVVRGRCGVPGRTTDGGVEANQAIAVAVNIVAVGATGPGHLTAWPANKPRPQASLINYSPMAETGGLNIANGVILPMCDQVAVNPCGSGDISFVAAVSPVHLVIDIVGYFAVPVLAGSARYGAGGIDSFLCLNQTTGIRYGLSRKLGTATDAPRLCPAGTWVCSLAEMGVTGCDVGRPDGNCDLIDCRGVCFDLAATNHRGWVADTSSSTTSASTFSEGGQQASDPVCHYNPAWCCSRE